MTKKQEFSAKVCFWCGICFILCVIKGIWIGRVEHAGSSPSSEVRLAKDDQGQPDYFSTANMDSFNQDTDITFTNLYTGNDVVFDWKDDMFNVIYDADKCTEAAMTFFDCMLPYLNECIEKKAKELF